MTSCSYSKNDQEYMFDKAGNPITFKDIKQWEAKTEPNECLCGEAGDSERLFWGQKIQLLIKHSIPCSEHKSFWSQNC